MQFSIIVNKIINIKKKYGVKKVIKYVVEVIDG